LSGVTPVSGSSWQFPVEVPDRPDLPRENRGVHANQVSPGWFGTYGTPVVAGRDFHAGDTAGAPLVAIVNRTLAARLFGDENPIGHRLVEPGRPGQPPRSMEIVGVVGDAVYRSPRETIPSTLYVAVAQRDLGASITMSVRVEAGRSPMTVTRELAAALAGVDPDLAVTFRALDDQVNAALVQERLLALLSAFFGGLALLLTGLGLYGVTAYDVSRRRAEMGIRMTLGATPGRVQALVVRRAGLLVALGIVVGGLGAWWATSVAATLVFGVEAHDAATFVAAAVTLAAAGLAAAWLPARRAARVDPAIVLRES
jgi:predicted permease